MTYSFCARLWLHAGDAGWHFVTLPADVADDIEEMTAPTRRGFGSVRVEVTVGATTWRTSLFPDTTAESYLLPMRQQVRRAEGLAVGDEVQIRIGLVDA